ncbi:hypothetical protein [uncultured Methanobrevibacter sp.]|uniref:hypothetical protein n=2 Tax=uncultured Methanobrevibacter sp. TaxID=253161 RepID=UPI0025E81101|nr:hypothetical protein [uncultured Methanobrevibacter sp.]
MNFKNIVLVILIILIFAGTFMFLMAHQAHPKDASKIMMTSSDNLTEGDNITVKLTDANNTPLANQVLNFSIVSESKGSVQKSFTTDSNGAITFITNNSTTGNCAIMVKYGGNEKFNGCNFTENVNINKKVIIPIKTNSTFILGNNTTKKSTNTSNSLLNYYQDDIITVEDYT